jgi:hypothetical protein
MPTDPTADPGNQRAPAEGEYNNQEGSNGEFEESGDRQGGSHEGSIDADGGTQKSGGDPAVKAMENSESYGESQRQATAAAQKDTLTAQETTATAQRATIQKIGISHEKPSIYF